ncbi:polymerase [Escherichia albertii]|nr:polymerase [Escherichia albertii]EFO0967747.1 polymerase [Escherichia albertii]EFO0999919.1 polymerase [Escherichia albertii]EFO1262807.1 polymerase [Escherichia albertii]EFO1269567.1 polymerase [Escherichia albertii]
MKFTGLKIDSRASRRCFFCSRRLFRQHDEFTCPTHFPSSLAML